MSMQRARDKRFATATKPTTWETPFFVAVVSLFFVAMTPLVVQGVVLWFVTGTFVWPNGQVWEAISGFAQAQPGVGLPAEARGALPHGVVLALTGLAEVAVACLLVVVFLKVQAFHGVGRSGLADTAQAVEALGVQRLHRNAAVIRPDLYGHGRRWS